MAAPGRLTFMLVLLSSGGGGHAWRSAMHSARRSPCHVSMCGVSTQLPPRVASMGEARRRFPHVSFSPLLDFSPSLSSFVRTGSTARGEELASFPQHLCLETAIVGDLRSSQVDLALMLVQEGMEDKAPLSFPLDPPHAWSQEEVRELQWPDIQRRLEEEKVWLEDKANALAVSAVSRASFDKCFAMARSLSFVSGGKLFFNPVVALFQPTAPKGASVEARGDSFVLTADEGREGERVG
eukprot:369856-Hanusia_phi.AAC.1